MPLEVGLVGLAGSGKTTLFRALTGAPADIEYGKANVGMANVPDDRLDVLADTLSSAERTPAAMRVVDPPGLSPAVLGDLRKVDALIAVGRNFGADVDPARDAESLALELLVADRDHVEKRLERVRQQAKSGDPAVRKEVESLERVLAHVEAGGSLADFPGELPPELEPLTTKPLVRIVNGGEGGLDLALEGELAELDPEEAAGYREGLSALDATVAELFAEAGLLTFFTASDKEARAWTLHRGQTALDAAATIHTDIARGFIRCEVIAFDDLIASGNHAEAARRGLQRLEGKTYVVADGDVLNVRFNV